MKSHWYWTTEDGRERMGISESCPAIRGVWTAERVLGLRHNGWYGDTENQDRLMVGVVIRIGGAILAGWHDPDSDCYDLDLTTLTDVRGVEDFESSDELRDVARWADDDARYAAEREDEYQTIWRAKNDLADRWDENESEVDRIRDLFDCRHHGKTMGDQFAKALRAYKRERQAIKDACSELDVDLEEVLSRDY